MRPLPPLIPAKAGIQAESAICARKARLGSGNERV